MKKYVFRNGNIEAENLSGEDIKKHEKSLGDLIGVFTNKGYVPVFQDVTKIFHKGVWRTFKEWSDITGIAENTLRTRYSKGERGFMLFRKVGI